MNVIGFSSLHQKKAPSFGMIRVPIKETPAAVIKQMTETDQYAVGRTTATKAGKAFHIFKVQQGSRLENSIKWWLRTLCPEKAVELISDPEGNRLILNAEKYNKRISKK